MENLEIYSGQKQFVRNNTEPASELFDGYKKTFKIEYFDKQTEDFNLENDCFDTFTNVEVMWLIEGSVTVDTDCGSFIFEAGTLCRFLPGQAYTLLPKSPLTGYRICFSQEFLYMKAAENGMLFWENQLAYTQKFPVLTVGDDMRRELGDLLKIMCREYQRDFQHKSKIISGLMSIFFIYCGRLYHQNQHTDFSGSEGDIFNSFLVLVKKHFVSKKSVAGYAHDLRITHNYLNEIVRKISGHTAGYHIQRQILHQAKQLAARPDLSMKQIAYTLGFLDIGHFSKFFKNKSGMNFTEFRKKAI